MLNYLKKFAIEIVPSVAATVIGAYIVNHYINAKPATPQAPAAAVLSSAQPRSDVDKPEAGKPETARPEAKAGDAEIGGIPASGVKAKGISEKALLEKNAAAEKAIVVEKPAEKPVEKPAETTASLPVETKPAEIKPVEAKRPAPLRAAKSPPPAQSVLAAAPADAAAVVEERRDANDLARAAIERLRVNGETPQRAQPPPRAPEAAHVPEEPRVITASPSPVRPLPPPIVVAAPSEAPDPAALRGDPSRPTPPAEIPLARPPLDLRAEAGAELPKQKANVAEEMLSAAKSMFHSVLPK